LNVAQTRIRGIATNSNKNQHPSSNQPCVSKLSILLLRPPSLVTAAPSKGGTHPTRTRTDPKSQTRKG
jgi:hypothetical protein